VIGHDVRDPTVGVLMAFFLRSLPAALCGAALLFSPVAAFAQSNPETKSPDKPPAAAAADTAKADEFTEAARSINGPAGNPECVWLGRRVVALLWRDDLDTAFRHLDLYDRFGCPGPYIQSTFRCVVRQGPIDPKAPESISARVHACWVNPTAPTPPPAAINPPAAGTPAK
jgi:hypothetical protein